MVAERTPNDPDHEFWRIIRDGLGSPSEETENTGSHEQEYEFDDIQEISAQEQRAMQTHVLDLLDERGIRTDYFRKKLYDIPVDQDAFVIIKSDLAQQVHTEPAESTEAMAANYFEDSHLYERYSQITWMEKITLMLPPDILDTEPAEMILYESKQQAQAAAKLDDGLDNAWREALIDIIDSVATGPSIAELSEEEMYALFARQGMVEDAESFSSRYRQYAKKAIQKTLQQYDNESDDFRMVVATLTMAAVEAYQNDPQGEQEIYLKLAIQTLSSLDPGLDHSELVAQAFEAAAHALQEM